MKSFSEPSARTKAVEALRWIGVLPAAVLSRVAFDSIIAVIFRVRAIPGGVLPDKSALVESLQLLILYPPPVAIFVLAGALMAPRYRRTTVVVLAVMAIALSLTIHVLLPDNVGANNYKHFTVESAGAIVGASFIFFSHPNKRPDTNTSMSNRT